MTGLATLAAAGAAALYAALEPYRRTAHGPNPWSFEGFLNVLRLSGHFEAARHMVDGTVTSVWRSPTPAPGRTQSVNEAAGGVQSSRHTMGLAVDIKPRALSPKEAAGRLYEAAVRGELGPVRTVLEEPTVVHLDYFASGEATRAPTLGYWERKS